MLKKQLLLFLTLCSFGFAFAQNPKNVNTSVLQFESVHLENPRNVFIYLPPSYEESNKRYPVAYILDGQRYFWNGISFQNTLTWQNMAPEFMIVAIESDLSVRRTVLRGAAEGYHKFLEALISKIDKEYRTLTTERIFFGWEMAAGFGLQLATTAPELFKGYLFASPTHFTKSRLDAYEAYLKTYPKHVSQMYAALGTVETWATGSLRYLDSLQTQYPSTHRKWIQNLSETENHYTTPLTVFNEGLRSYFSDYGPLRFYTIQEFEDFGGIPALKNHYQKRSKRYDTSPEIHLDTKHYLLLQSVKENQFALFDELMELMDGMTFIKGYYNFGRWFKRYADFYQLHQKPKKAYDILAMGLEKFPESAVLHNAMGDHYKLSGKKKQAKASYQQAIALAKTNNDEHLATYEANLKALSKR